MRATRTISFGFSVFLMTLAFSALAADVVVIASSAPNIMPGQIVNADGPLEIPAGARVTLISESGKTVTVNGPHSGPLSLAGESSGDPSLIKALAGLVSVPIKETGSLAFIRKGTVRTPPTETWVIDVGRSGDHCVPAGGPVKLWRAAKTGALLLKNLADKSKSVTDWPAETNTLEWPSQVTLDGGTKYLARLIGSLKKTVFVVHLVPADLPSDAHRAVWMAEKGCVEQAKRLLAGLR